MRAPPLALVSRLLQEGTVFRWQAPKVVHAWAHVAARQLAAVAADLRARKKSGDRGHGGGTGGEQACFACRVGKREGGTHAALIVLDVTRQLLCWVDWRRRRCSSRRLFGS